MRWLCFSIFSLAAMPVHAAKATLVRTADTVTAVSSPSAAEWPHRTAEAMIARLSGTLARLGSFASLDPYSEGSTSTIEIDATTTQTSVVRFAVLRFKERVPPLLLQINETTITCAAAAATCVPSVTLALRGPIAAFERLPLVSDSLGRLRGAQTLTLLLTETDEALTFQSTFMTHGDGFESGIQGFLKAYLPKQQAPSQSEALRLVSGVLRALHEEVAP